MQIIGHKSLTVHQICTKFDTRIHLWTPYLCAKFQGNRSTCLCFIAMFASVRKDVLCVLIYIYIYLIKNSQAVKNGAAPKKAMVKKDVKSKVAAKKWL